MGAVELLDALGSDTKLFCPPETANNLDRVRLIVAYIEARPEPIKNGFRLLARMKPSQKLSLGKIDIAQEFLPISGLERLVPNSIEPGRPQSRAEMAARVIWQFPMGGTLKLC